jgi:rhomboid protease GluP
MNQDQPTPQPSSYPPAGPVGQTIMRPAFRPYVTFVLIGVCVAVYLIQLASNYFFNVDIPAALGLKDNLLIMQGQVWRLITPIFLHSSSLPSGLFHIGFNMYALYIFGPQLELFYGRWRYLALFMVSGFAGNVMSFIFTQSPSLGASTAIFGLLGAEGVLIYQNREVFGSIARRALTQVVLIAAVNMVIGFSTPGIDVWGHLGGLIGGTLYAWFGGPILQKQGLVPPYTVTNVRTRREVIIAGMAVFGLFFFLTLAVMFMRKS